MNKKRKQQLDKMYEELEQLDPGSEEYERQSQAIKNIENAKTPFIEWIKIGVPVLTTIAAMIFATAERKEIYHEHYDRNNYITDKDDQMAVNGNSKKIRDKIFPKM